MDFAEVFQVLRGHRGVGNVTHHDLYGRRLHSFREQGRWAFSVTWPQRMGESEEYHVVAVEVQRKELVLVDNKLRVPTPIGEA